MRKPVRAAVAITVLLSVVLGGCSPEAMKKVMDEERTREADDELLNNSGFGRSFTYLRDHFPADYAAMRADFIRAEDNGKSREEMGEIGFDFAQRLTVGHAADFAAASSTALARYRAAKIAYFETLQSRSIAECAYAAAPTSARTNTASDTRGNEDLLYTTLETMFDGQTSRVQRHAPTRADYKAEVDALELYGLTRDDIISMAKTETFVALPDDRKCKLAVATLKAINSLPPEQADLITVEVFNENAAEVSQRLKARVTAHGLRGAAPSPVPASAE